MKNLLALAAIVLAIGAGSVPATAKVKVFEQVTYHDSNNTIEISVKKENAASERITARGGQADNRFSPAEIYFCDGGKGSTVSDVLVISAGTPDCATKTCAATKLPNQVGSVSLELLSDPLVNIVGTCQTAGKSDGIPVFFVDERTCKGRCEVGHFFGLDDDDVTVISK